MIRPVDRRAFLASGAALAAASVLPGFAEPRFRVALAAYSLRKALDLKKPTMTLVEFVGQAADWGFDGVELTEYFFEKPVTPESLLKLKRACIRAGMPITGTPVGNTFTLPAGEARDKQIALVKNWIDVSADLGSPAIRIFAGSAPKGGDEAEARKWAVECLQQVLPHAEKRGVVLAMENHGGIVATADQLLELMKAVKSDWFGINLDTGNFHSADIYAELEKCAPLAVTCQVKVEISQAGKRSETDYGRIVALLRKANYHGFLTLEYEAAEDPSTAIPKHLDLLRKAIG